MGELVIISAATKQPYRAVGYSFDGQNWTRRVTLGDEVIEERLCGPEEAERIKGCLGPIVNEVLTSEKE